MSTYSNHAAAGSNDPDVDDTEARSVDTSEYDAEGDGDYNVLQTQIVDGGPEAMTPTLTDDHDDDEAGDVIANDNSNNSNDNNNNNDSEDWSPRTSFTADSPYFDAFCEGEIGSLNLLSDTLGDIAIQTRAYVRAGAAMEEATRQLARACQLRRNMPEEHSNHSGSDEWAISEEEMQQQRRHAVGEEMANILELLGQVRC